MSLFNRIKNFKRKTIFILSRNNNFDIKKKNSAIISVYDIFDIVDGCN